MIMTAPAIPEALGTADRIAATLASPRAVLPAGRQARRATVAAVPGRRRGRDRPAARRARPVRPRRLGDRPHLADRGRQRRASPPRLTRACSSAPPRSPSSSISPPPPAGRYRRALAAAGRRHPARHPRPPSPGPRAHRPPTSARSCGEFDLIRGLAGLGAYHLAAHPGHEVTRDVLAYLVRLTEPIPGADGPLPPWWTDASTTGEPSPDFPGGHGNFGMSHGISAVLAVLSLALLRGVTVPGRGGRGPPDLHLDRPVAATATDASPWWPGFITIEQADAQRVDPALRPRPSWCYGVAGTARAQQLAGIALRDPRGSWLAEAAILAVLRDPDATGPPHRDRPVPRHRRAAARRVADGRRRPHTRRSTRNCPASPLA